MANSNTWQPNASLDAIRLRARLLKRVRVFFDQRHFIEVDTPTLSRAAATDPNIDSFITENTSGRWYLHTSPEFPMKRLLAAYAQPIYQLCKVFRQGESGPLHNPEFTMLEWYRPGYKLSEIMDETRLLLLELVKTLPAAVKINASAPVITLSYAVAFEKSTGINPHDTDAQQLRDYATSKDIEIPVGMGEKLDEWLDWLLTRVVMPAFPPDQFVFLHAYPASQAALATISANDEGVRVAERFEVFLGEVELVNGFYELTDANEQAERFRAENNRRMSAGGESLPLDESLIASLEHLLPCAGVAVGVDRLLMVLGNYKQIQEVISFSQEHA